MRVAMIGSGYVGLVSGACFADFGHDVTCIDNDSEKISLLNEGKIPIFEPGLQGLVARNIENGRLNFSNDLPEAVRKADVVFIAVGTPSRRGDGFADLSYVYAVAREIADSLNGYTLIVTKSTVPVGTGDEVEKIIRERCPDADFCVASNPEFLREGAAISDFKRPDRVVVGIENERARDLMYELYRPLFLNETPIVFTDRRTSELIKYAANAYLATKITFINEMADLCEVVGADVQEIARGIGLDKRIGPKFLHAGPGYGGSCFPKDTLALVRTATEYKQPLNIVEAVIASNQSRKERMAAKVIKACGGSVEGLTIAILGLTFKPNTDDMRDAPSLTIIANLQENGVKIRVYDPEGMDEAKKYLDSVEYCTDSYQCIEGADAMVIITEWDQFRALDMERVRATMKTPTIVDLRNIYSPAEMALSGTNYFSVGRPEIPDYRNSKDGS